MMPSALGDIGCVTFEYKLVSLGLGLVILSMGNERVDTSTATVGWTLSIIHILLPSPH
jgi:hypothetical protein